MLEIGLFVIMLAVILGLLWLMVWWGNRVERRELSKADAKTSPASAGTNSAPVVLPQQHQPASAPVPDFEAVIDFLARHNLTDEQAIDLFATAHRAPDDYFISANKLRDAIGGNEAAVKARVASHRPKPPAPRPAARIERPVNGW